MRIVVDSSPAFTADIFPGDILMSVGNDKVQSPELYKQLLDQYEGQTMTFQLNRDGQMINKTFRILSYKDPI